MLNKLESSIDLGKTNDNTNITEEIKEEKVESQLDSRCG